MKRRDLFKLAIAAPVAAAFAVVANKAPKPLRKPCACNDWWTDPRISWTCNTTNNITITNVRCGLCGRPQPTFLWRHNDTVIVGS